MTTPFSPHPSHSRGIAQETDPNNLPHEHWPLWFKAFALRFWCSQRSQYYCGGGYDFIYWIVSGGGLEDGDALSRSSRVSPLTCSPIGTCHCITANTAPIARTVTVILLGPSLSKSLFPHNSSNSSHGQPDIQGHHACHPQHSSHTQWQPLAVSTLSITQSRPRFPADRHVQPMDWGLPSSQG